MQIQNDEKLLLVMMEDLKRSPDMYKPTNYWTNYEKVFLPELLKYGLKDFRRRKNSVLSSFGATDISPSLGIIDLKRSRLFNNRITRKIPSWFKIIELHNTFLNKFVPISRDIELKDIERLAYEFTKLEGEKNGAKSLDNLEASLFGNPENVFYIDNKPYTISILNYYLRYAYCCKYINFDRISTIIELGCGSGKQVEVIKKLHPHINFLLFDIPPQLYVCEQYLKSVFPDVLVSYRDTKPLDSLKNVGNGSIYIFGNWKFPIIKDSEFDLFWNAASFQEMEPSVVNNYLKYVRKNIKFVFLQEAMMGKEIAKKEGEHGVLEQVKLRDYIKELECHELIDLSLSLLPLKLPSEGENYYSDSFWKVVD